MSADLTRRLQVLLDVPRYERLERAAHQRGTSVATIVREAIDAAFSGDVIERAEAARQFLAEDPLPLGDWTDAKNDLDGYYGPHIP